MRGMISERGVEHLGVAVDEDLFRRAEVVARLDGEQVGARPQRGDLHVADGLVLVGNLRFLKEVDGAFGRDGERLRREIGSSTTDGVKVQRHGNGG